jgi:hypothetical protein
MCVTIFRINHEEKSMASTVNFTGSVDRALLQRAKIVAAKSETSINALFNAELRYLVETFEASEKNNNQNFRALLDFSLGRQDAASTLQGLGIDNEEDLFLLMAQAHLPMPRLPDNSTRAMTDSLHALLD